ncbi:two-component sensor histidine kinase [Lacihabitans sp. LS3-19]|uniref:sensor histidine kinase n=1 Tax=Lacihabitans sp. LS3-19 TaxID=2487335 RepID=UPI0020CF09B1|nr:ATP-binding protein [Lacihabitans sp. LS3-19]MCP9770097.1 two-component sensor histidine kinase [Lacihabitans sp. LS3-19]
MFLSPRWISLFTSLLVTSIVVAFLSFVPAADSGVLFVAGISSFFSTFFFTYYIVDLLVFREVNQIYVSIQKLKIRDFDISRKSLLRSVNPLKKLNREISNYVSKKEEEIGELKRMEIFRREFLADVSHELKTPIFAAQGFVHTLIDGAIDDPEVAVRFLKKAAKSLDGLDVLVRDLVVLSQVETGDLKMHFDSFNIVEVIKEIFEQLENKANKRNTELVLKPKEKEECFVFGDKQRLSQVLTNLVENAIKYGKDNGKVVLELKIENRNVEISVEDNGPGIPQDQLPRIFERFYRVDKSRSRETGGTGLGLAIVKHILNAHDSVISVTSKIDKGTRFTFHLTKPPKEFA